MMIEKIICNVKTVKVTRTFVQDSAPVSVDVGTELAECKQRLIDTDYVVVKIAEGAASREEYADLLAERKALRERIGALEQLQK